VRRRRAAVTIFLVLGVLLVLLLATAPAQAGKKEPLTLDEAAMLAAVGADESQAYAWWVMLNQVYGWGPDLPGPYYNETVAGADGPRASYTRALQLAAEMEAIGLEPLPTAWLPAENQVAGSRYLEAFHVDGWEELETSVTVTEPEALAGMTFLAKQNFKGAGTGPDGFTREVVYVADGRWDDFERAGDITGKIVLFHRKDPMFYGEPTLAEAKARGAVGAIMDYPVTPDEDVKTDCIIPAIPVCYISTNDANLMIDAMDAGETVRAKLVVDNEVGDFPQAYNVVGMIRGDRFPDEYVYLTTHFDHWWTSAADDGAGVASMFAIAKAITDGIAAHPGDGTFVPDRTIVFVSFDSEELGGPPDTWYDWCMGSFAHIVGQLPASSTSGVEWTDEDLKPAIHTAGDPGMAPGKIVAMWNMDVIGVKDAIVYVETTPDVTNFIKRCARATGLFAAAPTAVYWPPSSYDDWQFYMAGVPVMQIAWWGPAYDILYHTTGDVPEVIDPMALLENTEFNMLATWRMANSGVAPYTLTENLEVAEEGIANLAAMDAGALGKADISELETGLAEYEAALYAASRKMSAKNLSDAKIAAINAVLMEQAIALNPHLFDWDCTMIPGWTGLFLFDTYANDLKWLNAAIAALKGGDDAACLKALEGVTTMEWGQYVGDKGYTTMMDHIAYTPHLLWGYGFIPQLTDVHTEFMSMMGRYESGAMSKAEILASLTAKRDAIYGFVTMASGEAGTAFSEAAAVLETM
jgi:hypothetical protein